MYTINFNETNIHSIERGFNKYFSQFRICILLLFIPLMISCRKFVEVGAPPDKLTQGNVYSNDLTANNVLVGLYNGVNNSSANMAKYGGLLADEFTLWSGADLEQTGYYSNSLVSSQSNNTGKEIWNTYYNLIFGCNAAIEGINTSEDLSPSVKKQLSGEAQFLRAWLYFYLVNLYGDLPLALGTDPIINSKLSRSSSQIVYSQIIEDLKKAEGLLSATYVNGQLVPYNSDDSERVRPTIWAAKALLARVYLFMGQYSNAEAKAGEVIAYTRYFDLAPYSSVFEKNSREAIWQLQPTEVGWNTLDGKTFNLAAFPEGFSSEKSVYLSDFLISAFNSNDERSKQWIGDWTEGGDTYYFPLKYKIGKENLAVNSPESLTEYTMMLRLGEQYLIRSEARARLNNLTAAISDLDKIRGRANLSLIANINPGISQDNLLSVILHERQIELFSEWGHRWFDLKRTGNADAIMQAVTPSKGGHWESTDQLLPLPYNDLLYNANLIQNAGY